MHGVIEFDSSNDYRFLFFINNPPMKIASKKGAFYMEKNCNKCIHYILIILKTELHAKKNLSSVKYEFSSISGMTNLKTISL